MIVLANAKKPTLLELERSYLNTLTYRLYTNNYTPDGAMTAGSFDELAAGYGYVGDTPGFPAATLVGSDAQVVGASMTWTFTGVPTVPTIYGYYVTEPGGAVVYAERAPAPFTITAAGQTYTVTPRVLLGTY